jgi:hypothetical protein
VSTSRDDCQQHGWVVLNGVWQRYKSDPVFHAEVGTITHLVMGHKTIPADPLMVARAAVAVSLDYVRSAGVSQVTPEEGQAFLDGLGEATEKAVTIAAQSSPAAAEAIRAHARQAWGVQA